MNTNKKLVTSKFYKNIIKQFVTVALLLKKEEDVIGGLR